MADLDTVGILDVGGDGPITAAGRAQVTHFSKCSLFCLVLDQRALLADPPAERPIAAEILPGAPLMACQALKTALQRIARPHQGFVLLIRIPIRVRDEEDGARGRTCGNPRC
jgi:hypothetical protein